MASPILPLIDQTLVSFTGTGPEFQKLVADTLGNAADSTDGFDAALNSIMALFDATDTAMNALDPVLFLVGSAVDAFNAIDVGSSFVDAIAAVPTLTDALNSAKLQAPAGITLPALPSPPGVPPQATPPTVCVPIGGTPPPGTITV